MINSLYVLETVLSFHCSGFYPSIQRTHLKISNTKIWKCFPITPLFVLSNFEFAYLCSCLVNCALFPFWNVWVIADFGKNRFISFQVQWKTQKRSQDSISKHGNFGSKLPQFFRLRYWLLFQKTNGMPRHTCVLTALSESIT